MTLLQLLYFETLARVLHFTKASEELHIAQPSLSYSIKELEKELGVKLFAKKNRKIYLTEYGERFLPYVQKSLLIMREGTTVLKQMNGVEPLNVRLGYFHSISASLVPAIVEEVYKDADNKQIRFQFTEKSSFEIFSMLKEGKLDMAFSTNRGDWAESITIMRQPLFLTVPFDHPLAHKKSVTFEDFARESFVLLDKSNSLRTNLDELFTRRGVIPKIMFEVPECNAALQYVALGFGISILPETPGMKTERVAAIPIADRENEFFRTVYLSWDKGHPMAPAAQKVRNIIVAKYAAYNPA